tara:strand:+ start:602 stop:1129 length:528 start_codon:yes stop_codon:yes gene_type:complete
MSTLITSTAQIGTIKDTAGNNTAITIASTGLLTTGVKHAFYMYRNAAQTLVHAGGPTLVQFDAQRINEGNGITLGASAKYTVPSGAAGMYIIHGHGRLNTGTDGNTSLGLYLNGSGTSVNYHYNGYYDAMSVTKLINLADGDFVQMKMANSIGSNTTIGQPDAGDTVFFWGYRLG